MRSNSASAHPDPAAVGVPPRAGSGVDDELAQLERSAQVLADAATESTRWQDAHRRAALDVIDRAVAALTAAKAHLLRAEEASGTWQGQGDRDYSAYRGRTTRAGSSAAGAELRTAAVLTDMPAVEEALRSREISQRHVEAIARVAARATPVVTAALADPVQQAALVDLGRRLDGRAFARAVDRWVASLDPVSVERDLTEQRDRRYLRITDHPGGTEVHGLLDLRSGHRLRLALEAASPRPTKDDDRTPEQRRADALVAVAEHTLAAPDSPSGPTSAPHVSVILTEETWSSLTRTLRTDGPRAEGTARDALRPHDELARAVTGLAPATDEDGTPVPVSEAARILCDCALTRIVVDAEGRPVDVGRTQRLYTGHLRRAVVARDRGCVWPGCDRPPRWCEVHHLRWWDRDRGETSVENGALLCTYHHQEVHRRDLVLTRHPRATSAATGAALVAASEDGTDHGAAPDSRGAPRPAPLEPVRLVEYTLTSRTGAVIRAGSGHVASARRDATDPPRPTAAAPPPRRPSAPRRHTSASPRRRG